jgi:hypothetical protein
MDIREHLLTLMCAGALPGQRGGVEAGTMEWVP